MKTKIDHRHMGKSDLGWLRSHFHFSFADYYNPANIQFGALRVINDDQIAPHTGFDTHPHRDMEIITYVIDGALTHQDSMGNKRTLSRGGVQYMSAGTGIRHSEHNTGDTLLRLLQIWILPDRKGHTPAYGDLALDWEERKNRWLPIVSGAGGTGRIAINQDASIHVAEIDAGTSLTFPVAPGRQAYLVQIEGTARIGDITLGPRDALTSVGEDIVIDAIDTAHVLLIEMGEPTL